MNNWNNYKIIIIFHKYNFIFTNFTHQWNMKGSDDSSYSHARRGRSLSHNGLHLGRSGTWSLGGCRYHFITISQGQCNPHTSGNGATSIIDLIAERDARE